MMKSILSILLILFITVGNPVSAMSSPLIDMIETDIPNVSVTVIKSTVRVSGATGMTLSVYNVTGVRIKTIKVDGPDRQYDLDLPKGCYILKVGKLVRKISIS